ncbi:hypothetical protein, partial [Methanoculleus thermophilus]|uniref:hypothetical protein n=1 Tax=Methanoculleus thermophilus TaxID=2200 RepID=UPI003D8D6049
AERRNSHLPVLELRSCGTSQLAPTGARAPVLRNVATRTYRCSNSGRSALRSSKLFEFLKLLTSGQSHSPSAPPP